MTGLLWWIAPIGSALALVFAWLLYSMVMRVDRGNARMIEIADHVREGAMAYLRRQYKTIAVVFLALAAVFAVLAKMNVMDPFLPIAFLTGGFVSGLTGFLGMSTAIRASSRTANSAMKSLNAALQVAFRSGAVMGLVVVGFGLLFICAWYLLLDRIVYSTSNMVTGLYCWGLEIVPPGCTTMEKLARITTTMITFGMGASTQALFARVGGGIFTKAADVGADLAGKVEAGIPGDDPRNPVTSADNVGDVAGMGSDLFESYCGAMLAASALGAAAGAATRDVSVTMGYVLAPMIVAGLGNIVSIAGIFLVRCKEGAGQKNLLRALLAGTLGSSFLLLLAVAGMAAIGLITWGIFGSVVAGLLAGVAIGQSTGYFTSDEYPPTRRIAEQAGMGPATAITEGLSTGMYSSAAPAVVISIAVIAAFGCAGGFGDITIGLYGIGFAAVGMLSTLGITLATDAYGPVAGIAGGNARMAGLPQEVRRRTDELASLGKATTARGKGFAIGLAALTAMALLASFIEVVKNWVGRLALESPNNMFCAGRTVFGPASATMADILDFVDAYELHVMNPLVLSGMFIGAMMVFFFSAMTMKAVGRAAGAKQMIAPALVAIAVPVATGLVLGVPGVVGLLAGSMVCGFMLATVLNNAGGDPCKDTSGPALNILIKLMSMVCIVFAPAIVKFSPVIQDFLRIAPR